MSYGVPGTTAATTLAVFTRPGCAAFLQRTAAIAELVLFTASSQAYAQPLINLIDPTGRLFQRRILYKDATVRWSGKDGVKDLASLGRDLSRVVLVDNNPFTLLLQPCNGVPCQPYHPAQPDHQLLDVILPLVSILASVADVRPVLESRFGLPAWFRSRGYKAGY
jgi:RNA polymerase II subunit A small phosphatase-like protein